jgi:hypothetical protein
MRTCIKIASIAFAMAILPFGKLIAQQGHGPNNRGGYGPPDSCHIQLMVEDMTKQLSLTDQQKQQILNIHYKHMQDMKTLQGKYKNDCVGENEARNKLSRQMHADIMTVLNKEQQTKWDEIMKDRGGPHGGHHDWNNNHPGNE